LLLGSGRPWHHRFHRRRPRSTNHFVPPCACQHRPRRPTRALQAGYLFTEFHRSYWFGLVSNSSYYPIFGWSDPIFPGPTQTDYRNWGSLRTASGDDLPEPNNQSPPEYCGMASAAAIRSGAWGWADANCINSMVQMCRIQGGRGCQQRCRPALPPSRRRAQARALRVARPCWCSGS
jgi:hypothetical protein